MIPDFTNSADGRMRAGRLPVDGSSTSLLSELHDAVSSAGPSGSTLPGAFGRPAFSVSPACGGLARSADGAADRCVLAGPTVALGRHFRMSSAAPLSRRSRGDVTGGSMLPGTRNLAG